MVLILSKQGVEVLVVSPGQGGRLENQQVLIVGFGVLGEVIATYSHHLQ